MEHRRGQGGGAGKPPDGGQGPPYKLVRKTTLQAVNGKRCVERTLR